VRTPRPLLAPALAILAAVAVAPASVGAATREPVPVLAGTTTISGPALREMRVRLPRAVVLDIFIAAKRPVSDLDIVVGGTAKYPGVALSTLLPNGDPLALVVMRAPREEFCEPVACWKRPVFYEPFGLGPLECLDDCRRVRLPAGTYRLTLLGEGGTVTARLRLGGLPGRTALRPSAPSRASIRLFDVASGPGEAWLEGDRAHDIGDDEPGLAWTWLWVENLPSVESGGTFRGCLYEGGSSDQPTADPGPLCPTADVDVSLHWGIADPPPINYQWYYLSETYVCCTTGRSALKAAVLNEPTVGVGRRGGLAGWLPFDWAHDEPPGGGALGALWVIPVLISEETLGPVRPDLLERSSVGAGGPRIRHFGSA
jgi:hypothetical protein